MAWKRADSWVKLYIAVRQRYGHDVLCIDLQRADSLSCASVFRLDGKFSDEPIYAPWEEPGNRNKGVVLSKRCQVSHKSRGWKECVKSQDQDISKSNHHRWHKYPPDSAVFIYNDLLKDPTLAEDMAATYRTDRQTDRSSLRAWDRQWSKEQLLAHEALLFAKIVKTGWTLLKSRPFDFLWTWNIN